jgi:hypothetical protein
MVEVMKFPLLGGKGIEVYYDQSGIQEEGTFRVERAPVRSFLVRSMSRARIKMPSLILDIHRFLPLPEVPMIQYYD